MQKGIGLGMAAITSTLLFLSFLLRVAIKKNLFELTANCRETEAKKGTRAALGRAELQNIMWQLGQLYGLVFFVNNGQLLVCP